jgi:hypothetical protein
MALECAHYKHNGKHAACRIERKKYMHNYPTYFINVFSAIYPEMQLDLQVCPSSTFEDL